MVISCFIYMAFPYFRARYVFSRFQSERIGQDDRAQVEITARKIGARTYGVCNDDSCEWEMRLDNAQFPRWWRGSGELIFMSLVVHNGVLVRKSFGYGKGLKTDPLSPSSVSVVEQDGWGRLARKEPVAVEWTVTDRYPFFFFVVYMTPKASAQEQQLYTAFNFDCLWRYKGCRDVRELLPVAARFPAPPQP